MAVGYLDEQILKDIANAIREKTGVDVLIKPVDMANSIQNIPAGGSSRCQVLCEPFVCNMETELEVS